MTVQSWFRDGVFGFWFVWLVFATGDAAMAICDLGVIQQDTASPASESKRPLDRAFELLAAANRRLELEQYDGAAKLAFAAADLAKQNIGVQQRCGECLYRSGHAKASLLCFDRVIELDPQRMAGNWQRGIALANVGKWGQAAEQFQEHHRVNPDDVENTAWYFLCVAKSQGVSKARESLIPSRGDPRQPMMSILAMLHEQKQPADVLADARLVSGPESRQASAKFYADLYVGLYYDSLGEQQQAKRYLKRSLTYGSYGYMTDVARVYVADRFDDPQPDKPQNRQTPDRTEESP